MLFGTPLALGSWGTLYVSSITSVIVWRLLEKRNSLR